MNGEGKRKKFLKVVKEMSKVVSELRKLESMRSDQESQSLFMPSTPTRNLSLSHQRNCRRDR